VLPIVSDVLLYVLEPLGRPIVFSYVSYYEASGVFYFLLSCVAQGAELVILQLCYGSCAVLSKLSSDFFQFLADLDPASVDCILSILVDDVLVFDEVIFMLANLVIEFWPIWPFN
jgi:hypothetical protein